MAAPLEAWEPTLADVAGLVPHRVYDGTGAYAGTFTADTRPTAAQVASLIRGVQSEVVARVGSMPDQLAVIPAGGTNGDSPAGHVVALGTAALVESQFFPDDQGGTDSAAAVLERRYREALAGLAAAANDYASGADPGGARLPAYAFPDVLSRGLATSYFEGSY